MSSENDPSSKLLWGLRTRGRTPLENALEAGGLIDYALSTHNLIFGREDELETISTRGVGCGVPRHDGADSVWQWSCRDGRSISDTQPRRDHSRRIHQHHPGMGTRSDDGNLHRRENLR